MSCCYVQTYCALAPSPVNITTEAESNKPKSRSLERKVVYKYRLKKKKKTICKHKLVSCTNIIKSLLRCLCNNTRV